jgi:hypothetical protein
MNNPIGIAAHPRAAAAASTITTRITTDSNSSAPVHTTGVLSLPSSSSSSSLLEHNPFAEEGTGGGLEYNNTNNDDDKDDDSGSELAVSKTTSTTITSGASERGGALSNSGSIPSTFENDRSVSELLYTSVAWDDGGDDASPRWDDDQVNVIIPSVLHSSSGTVAGSGFGKSVHGSTTTGGSGLDRVRVVIEGSDNGDGDFNYEEHHDPLLHSPRGNHDGSGDYDIEDDGRGTNRSSAPSSDPGVTRPGLTKAVEEFEESFSSSGQGDDDDDDEDGDDNDKGGSGVSGKRGRGSAKSRRGGVDRKTVEDKEKTVLVHIVCFTLLYSDYETDVLNFVSCKGDLDRLARRCIGQVWHPYCRATTRKPSLGIG